MKLKLSVVLMAYLFVSLIKGEIKAGDLPFGATISLPGVGKTRKVEKSKPFGFIFCLNAFETRIANIKIDLSLPPEVKKLNGKTVWQGQLAPNDEGCVNVSLESVTEMEKWSQSIHAHMQFMHEGVGFTWDVNWSHKGYEDTGFIPIKK